MPARWLCIILVNAAVAALAIPRCRAAEGWPSSPIRAISPISPGSAGDIIARTVLAQVAERLGKPIVVENRPGAEGTIGTAAVARAAPDGQTILVHTAAHTSAAATYRDLPYDAVRDFVAVASLARLPIVLVVPARSGIHSLGELVEAARRTPAGLNYAAPAVAVRLMSERFRLAAGFDAQAIPFKGAPEALTELMAGRIDFFFCPALAALPLVRGGQLTALATTGATRMAALLDVPTLDELGFTNGYNDFWVGVFAPARTPRDRTMVLNAATSVVLKRPAVIEKLAGFGAEPLIMLPEAFDAYVRREIEVNVRLVKESGLSVR